TENMNSMKEWFAQHTNPKRLRGTAGDALVDADVFIGLSGPGVVGLKDIKAMRRDPIVFAMANPIPEIQPEEAGPHVKVMATGRVSPGGSRGRREGGPARDRFLVCFLVLLLTGRAPIIRRQSDAFHAHRSFYHVTLEAG